MALKLDTKGVIVPCPSCGKANRLALERVNEKARCAHCKTELPEIAAPVEVNTVPEFDALVSRTPVPILVDFWAPWCGPCKMVAPEVEKVAQSMKGRLVAAKVNTDALPELGQRFGIKSIPTLAVFSSGREVDRLSGAAPAASIVQLAERAMRQSATTT